MYLYKRYTRKMFNERGLEYPFVRCASMPFPLQYYMEDRHEQSRFKRCIVCGKQVSREKYRKGTAFDLKKDGKERCVLLSDTLLSRVQHDFPTYDPANRALPLSVCATCQNRKLSRKVTAKKDKSNQSDTFFRPKSLNPITDKDKAQYERLLNGPHCGEGNENQHPNCVLCTTAQVGPKAKKNNEPPTSAPTSPARQLPPKKRKLKPTDRRYKRNKTPAALTKKDCLFGRMETRSSAKGMVRFARGQRRRAAAGDSPVTAPSTSELKRYYELLINKTFRNFFQAKKCEYSSEGFAVLVKDVAEYVRAITHISGKQVRIVKFFSCKICDCALDRV